MRRALSARISARVSAVVLVFVALAGPIGTVTGSAAATTRAVVPPGVDPRVFVIGDSVILGAQDALVARLTGWNVTFLAKESFFTWQAPTVINAFHATVGDISIVALGNNDGEDPGLFAHAIDQVMSAFGPVRKVLWVNLRQFRPWVPAANAQLVAATARYPNLEIVDWDARATPDPSLVYSDGLHLNPAGRDAMAALVGDRVDAAAAQLAAPPPTAPPTTVPTTAVPLTVPRVAAGADRSVLGALDPLGTPLVAAAVVRSPSAADGRDADSGGAAQSAFFAVGAAVALVLVGTAWHRRSRNLR
jgi:hypothetical protein